MSSENVQQEGVRRNRERLAKFYGSDATSSAAAASEQPARTSTVTVANSNNPLDINSPSFDPEMYSQRLIKDASLAQLMAHENEIVKQIHALDSDMQTLVYENYNKFIAATDTIKKMRVDFRGMEAEMDRLAEKMSNITSSSARVSDALRNQRKKVAELSGTHSLLRKLQFLFELPAKLKVCITEANYAQGVAFYLRAQQVLEQYQHMPSFGGIKRDCDAIMVELKTQLKSKLSNNETSPAEMSECVNLLLQLDEPAETLCQVFLETSGRRLDDSMAGLEKQISLASAGGLLQKNQQDTADRPSDAYESPMDILEFVDLSCNTFLSDICLYIASFNETFAGKENPSTGDSLMKFVTEYMDKFFDCLARRMSFEKNLDETAILVRALDRFHRRLQAICRLIPPSSGVDFARLGLDLVLTASKSHCDVTLDYLKKSLDESLMETRRVLVLSRRPGEGEADLKDLNSRLMSDMVSKVRSQATNLQLFIDSELTFAVKSYFRAQFCRSFAREGVFVAYFRHFLDVATNLCTDAGAIAASNEKSIPPILLLLLSRTCLDLQSSTTEYLINLINEQFFIDDTSGGLTTLSRLNESYREVAQKLLNHYVRLQGQVLSQMLRKSVETRDWLNSVEPRTVRAVMKRVVEETSCIDAQVGGVYEEGSRKARSSDSSRRARTVHSRSQFGGRSSGWSQLNSSLASNIQKMFNEKIEIFSPVEFSRISILTGIVKIALKTLLECVRLRTFSRFGFQQMQVDTHYLSLFLWRFVSDENLVTFLLDEVMTSTVHRCADPVPMETSVVEVICDRS